MKYLPVALLALCQAAWVTAWAQEVPAGDDQGQQQQDAAPPAAAKSRGFPLEVAGYLGFRHLKDDDLDDHRSYREYSGSIFLSKTIGRWVFHSEFNADTAPEYDVEGLHLFRRRPSLSVKLDNAFLNYNWRDWLQAQAGFLFVPAYWRTHRYQSTTLVVDEPLVDQTVFPTTVRGLMVDGDKYLEDGGFSYQFYAGASQESEGEDKTHRVDRLQAAGGKFVFHLPSRHFMDTFDVGYHRLEERTEGGEREHLNGVEVLLEKGRARFLGEFAHASVKFPGALRSFRQGYYLQPSFRITRKLFAVAQYDWLNLDSRFDNESGLARQSLGLAYPPAPTLSLKIEADRYEPQRGRSPAYYGASMAVVYFFRLP